MPLSIDTFDNLRGGSAFFKAIDHPLAAEKFNELLRTLSQKASVAIYDPLNLCATFGELHDLNVLPIAEYFIQNVERHGSMLGHHQAIPITEITNCKSPQLFVATFDAHDYIEDIRHLLPSGIEVLSFDQMRLPSSMLSDSRAYLSPINFATNFVFFRECAGHHTRITTTNYWTDYGAKSPALWCRIYDATGTLLVEWQEELGSAGSIVVLDSRAIRGRFNLPEFVGQLFIHAIRIAGHDTLKYALDTYGDEAHVLSSTHDANSWPADYYAGLPAPDTGEDVVLWVQNSHAIAIPPDEVGLNVMGGTGRVRLSEAIPPFGTHRLSVKDLLPGVRWPRQIEVTAGKYFVRPRYEVFTQAGRQRMSHVNVQRTDLMPDPKIATLGNIMGKGYLVVAPVLPVDRYSTVLLPTPMATTQMSLPLTALVYDATGKLAFEHRLGNLPRDHAVVFDVTAHMKDAIRLDSGFGHVELAYDFSVGAEADGWFHALFRYVDRNSGHIAETNFGSHIFNTVMIYKNEPQSYRGYPPGLSTRLFLRIGESQYETVCHLIYPASTPWHERSSTTLTLFDGDGNELMRREVEIPCNGSRLWRVSEMFGETEFGAATKRGYVIVSDPTCRLFGYHGLIRKDYAFSLDHLFGF